MHIKHLKHAFLLLALKPSIAWRSFSMFLSSFCETPAYLADFTPGALFRLCTSSPESSEITSMPVSFDISVDFFMAFPLNVSLSSFTSGIPLRLSRVRILISRPFNSLLSSRSFFLFLVASKICFKSSMPLSVFL